MSSYIVGYGGFTWLSDFGQFWTSWVCDRSAARTYANKQEAELVAYAVEGKVEEVVWADQSGRSTG